MSLIRRRRAGRQCGDQLSKALGLRLLSVYCQHSLLLQWESHLGLLWLEALVHGHFTLMTSSHAHWHISGTPLCLPWGSTSVVQGTYCVPGGWDCHFPNSVLEENAQRNGALSPMGVLTAENIQHPLRWELQFCTHRGQPFRLSPTCRQSPSKKVGKNQSFKMLTNGINSGIGMILFLFSFCLSSLNFPFDSL